MNRFRITVRCFAAIAAALGVTTALAQRPGNAPGCASSLSATDAAAMLDMLVSRYGQLVVFDRNLDGQLDETERAQLATTFTQGTRPAELSARPPGLAAAPPAAITARIAAWFQRLAAYDSSRDGHFDAAERERLKADLVSGKAIPCGRP